jgi:hypothetical protein
VRTEVISMHAGEASMNAFIDLPRKLNILNTMGSVIRARVCDVHARVCDVHARG